MPSHASWFQGSLRAMRPKLAFSDAEVDVTFCAQKLGVRQLEVAICCRWDILLMHCASLLGVIVVPKR